jgi:plastocyanin
LLDRFKDKERILQMLNIINTRKSFHIIFSLLLGLSLLVAACQPDDAVIPDVPGVPGTGEEFTISMSAMAFSPQELTVPAGSTVVWSNTDTMAHTVTADDGSFDSGILEPGETFNRTFNEPGEYQYYCELHGDPGRLGMAGVIVVTDN